jgi:PAS domain-containing protein
MLQNAVADEILRKVAEMVRMDDPLQLQGLEAFPIAIYVTDGRGLITYFNSACIDFAGREPQILRDRWCVKWKLFTNAGDFLPHDQCPMAIAIRSKQEVRGITAVAERPDGTRINFLPFPTPVFDEAGELLGAINMLVSTTGYLKPQPVTNDPGTSRYDCVKSMLSMLSVDEIRDFVKEMESRLNRKPPPILN